MLLCYSLVQQLCVEYTVLSRYIFFGSQCESHELVFSKFLGIVLIRYGIYFLLFIST